MPVQVESGIVGYDEEGRALPGEASVSVAGTRFDAEGCREFSRLLAAAADELRSVNADAA